MNAVKERLADTIVELTLARRAREVKKKTRKRLHARLADTSAVDRELATMKMGIAATKAKRDALITRIIKERGGVGS